MPKNVSIRFLVVEKAELGEGNEYGSGQYFIKYWANLAKGIYIITWPVKPLSSCTHERDTRARNPLKSELTLVKKTPMHRPARQEDITSPVHSLIFQYRVSFCSPLKRGPSCLRT